MATVYAVYGIDIEDLNLNLLIREQDYFDFHDNINYTYYGKVYEDVVDIGYYGDSAAMFGGTGFSMNADKTAITGGTVTGYLEEFWYANAWHPWWGIEDISVSAVSLYNAALTASTADDYAIIRTALAGNDLFDLSDDDDRANGYGGNDILYGYGGDDILIGGAGNDTIDGGAGIDWADFSGVRANYTLANTVGGFIVSAKTGTDGTDTLKNIERLWFADISVALDAGAREHAGQAVLFIGMLAYPLIDDPVSVGAILSIFDAGYDMHELCQLAVDRKVVSDLAGSSSDLDLVRLVYRNIVGTEADAATANELASLVGAYSQAGFLATVAGLEINQAHVDLVGLQKTGIDFL